jgi:hypothetical protein
MNEIQLQGVFNVALGTKVLQLGTILSFIDKFYIDYFFNIFNIILLNYVHISYFSPILNILTG